MRAYIWVQKNWKSFRHKLFLHLFISSCNVTNVSTLKTIGSKWIRTCLKNKHPWNSYNKIHQKIIVVTAKSHKIACTSFSFNFLCMLLFSFQQLWWGYYLHTMCSVAVDSCNLYIISSKISRYKKCWIIDQLLRMTILCHFRIFWRFYYLCILSIIYL